MKKVLYIFFLFFVVGCKTNPSVPDISSIHIPFELKRFDQDFFAIDTQSNATIANNIKKLQQKYPSFNTYFFYNILTSASNSDSIIKYTHLFLNTYHFIYDTLSFVLPPTIIKEAFEQVKQGLSFIHYYFPAYQLPKQLITFIGPLDGYANILTPNSLAVGLQSYMGTDFFLYQTQIGQMLYPAYISRRFSHLYIPIDCIKNIINDMYPNKSVGQPLINQMIELGKRSFLLSHFLPYSADTLLMGYTQSQLNACIENERSIWAFFIANNYLYATDPTIVNDYINDGPSTPTIAPESPGMIGLFVGTQIVKKWASLHPKATLDNIMNKDDKELFIEAKYKP